MSRDHVAIIAALLVHAVLGAALATTPNRFAGPARTISVDVYRRLVVVPEPARTRPEEPRPLVPRREKRKIKRPPEPAEAPPSDETPAPPKDPPREPKKSHGATVESATHCDSD